MGIPPDRTCCDADSRRRLVIVGRLGRNRRDVAERLHETLTGAGAPLLGVIANGFKSGGRGGYGYGYGYDYAPPKPEPPADTPSSPNGAAAPEAPPVPSAGG